MKVVLLAALLLVSKCAADPALQIASPDRLALRARSAAPARFTVQLRDPLTTAAAFKLELTSSSKTITLPLAATLLDSHRCVLAARLSALPEGLYQATVTRGALRSAPISVFISTPFPRAARLTTTGTLSWHGQPFFPIGLYHVNHTDAEYALLAANGFNCIQGSFAPDLDAFRQTLDLAESHGLAVQVPLYTSNLVQANLPASLAKIRAAAAHPAVLSWKILDEPDADRNAAVRDEVPAAYLALKQLHPPQPLELTLSENDTLPFWTKASDLIQIDRYPIPGHTLSQVSDFAAAAMHAKDPWQNLTCVVQCGYTPDLLTQPSFEQARAMVYLALISGAKGISWYSRQEDDWDLTTSPLWPRLREINAEIATLAPPLLLGRNILGVKCSAPSVRFTLKLLGREVYLLATNIGPGPVDAVFTIPWSVNVRRVRLLKTGAPLALTSRTVHLPLGAPDSATAVFTLR